MTGLGRIEIFLEVAKQNSFAKAARTLGLTGPAVSKQVQALEDEGALYADRARQALDDLKEAAAQVQDLKVTPRGALKISAPLSFGHMHLLPVLSGFARKYPEVSLDITLEDRRVDVLAEGFDIAIRIGAMSDSSLIGKYLADCPLLLVASPAYLKRHGKPRTPADLAHHRMIAYSLQGGGSEWRHKDKTGRIATFRGNSIFKANTAEMMLQATLDSVGIALLPVFSVESYLRSGQLVRILPAYTTDPPRAIFALMPPNRYRAARVKLFLDWLTQACAAMPWETRAATAMAPNK